MVFPERSVNNFFLKEDAIKENLTAITLCLFAQVTPNSGSDQFVYSYAAAESRFGNGIYLALTSTSSSIFKLRIENDRAR